MRALKTAVVGLGRIGWLYHIPEIMSHDGFELVCVCDPVDERLKEASGKYNVNTYQEIDSMFEAESVDLVVIASPTKFHLSQTLKAFESGCDVFCEKPVVIEAQQMKAIAAGMEKYRRKFMAYQPHRAGDDIQCLKDILRLDLIGKPYMMKRTRVDYTRRNDWQALKKFGGGMLNNYGSHFIDQALDLVGTDITRVYYTERKIASLGDAEDVVKVVLETGDGFVVDIDINMGCAVDVQPWIVMGECGAASLNVEGNSWYVRYFKPSELTQGQVQKTLAAENRDYFNAEKIKWYDKEISLSDYKPLDYYQSCYDYFAMDKAPLVSCEQTSKLVDILCQCRQQM